MIKQGNDEQRDDFWDALEDIRAGMLGVDGRFVPMSHYVDRKAGELWFITAKGTELARETMITPEDAQYIVSSKSEHLYATISGKLKAETDKEKLNEIWNFIASAWFEGDKDDPELQLLCFDMREAEAWVTKGGASFIYETVKANLTDSKPDIGGHFKLTF